MRKNKPAVDVMKIIGISITKVMADEIEARAKSMHISKSAYCKEVLRQWIASKKRLTLSE